MKRESGVLFVVSFSLFSVNSTIFFDGILVFHTCVNCNFSGGDSVWGGMTTRVQKRPPLGQAGAGRGCGQAGGRPGRVLKMGIDFYITK